LTVSGTTITQSAQVKTAWTFVRISVYQVATDKVIVVYDETDIKARYITVSGTTATHQAANTIVASTIIQAVAWRPLVMLNSNIYWIIHTNGTITWFIVDATNYDMDVIKTIDYRLYIWASVAFAQWNLLEYWVDTFFVNDYSVSSKKTYLMNFDSHYILGILQEGGTATQSKKVSLPGQISAWHTSLSTSERYYINYNGTYTLDTSAYWTALGQISFAGKAISATQMIVGIPYEDL
jgi:hypothetical protein